MRILLLGASGQVGDAVQKLAQTPVWPSDWKLTAWDRSTADLSKSDELIQKITAFKPDLIWNAAAYTQVDQAETEVELCRAINTKAPAALAKYCANEKIPLIHYSTDYVYGDKNQNPHSEAELPMPLNEYGKSKMMGDQSIGASGCDHLILRTSWVFSAHGKNFVKTMLHLSKEKSELNVVSDQVGSPTYASDLARYTLEAVHKGLEIKKKHGMFPSGMYHLCNSGFVSWFDFAKAILPGFAVNAIKSSDYPTAAKRPSNSRLSVNQIDRLFSIRPRPWQEALDECLKKLS